MFEQRSFTIRISRQPCPKGIWVGPGSLLACPFKLPQNRGKQQILSKYRRWLWEQLHTKGAVHAKLLKLRNQSAVMDLTLVCWCPCCPGHASLIKACVEWLKTPGKYERMRERQQNLPDYSPDWMIDIP